MFSLLFHERCTMAHKNPKVVASLTALNLLRLEDRQQNLDAERVKGRNIISVASGEIRKFNAHLLEHFSCHLKLDFSAIKYSQAFVDLCNYGAIAA